MRGKALGGRIAENGGTVRGARGWGWGRSCPTGCVR